MWYEVDLETLAQTLNTNLILGLSSEEAQQRLQNNGPNLPYMRSKSDKAIYEIIKSFRNRCDFAQTTVIRDGNEIKVPDEELVVGDVVLLSAAKEIPADIRLIQCEKWLCI